MIRKANYFLAVVATVLTLSWLLYTPDEQTPTFSVIAFDAQDEQLSHLVAQDCIEQVFVIQSKDLPAFHHAKVQTKYYEKTQGPLAEVFPLLHSLDPASHLLLITETVRVDPSFIAALKANHRNNRLWCSLDKTLTAKVLQSKAPLHLAFLAHQPTWVAAKNAIFQKIDFRHLMAGSELIREAWAKALMIPVMEMTLNHQKTLEVESCSKDDWQDHERYALEIETLRKRKAFPNLSQIISKKKTLDVILLSDQAEDFTKLIECQSLWQKGFAPQANQPELVKAFPQFAFGPAQGTLSTRIRAILQKSNAEYIAVIGQHIPKAWEPDDLHFVSKNYSKGLVFTSKAQTLFAITPTLGTCPSEALILQDYAFSIHPRHMLIKKLLLAEFDDFETMKRCLFTGKSKDAILVRL